jgi:lipopolysaccharide export system protein LptA
MTAEEQQRPRSFFARRATAVLFAVVSTLGLPALAQQQAPSSVLGGFSRDNGPINIQSDSLTINDQKKIAIYKGNVVAIQGDNTLRTIELEVQYVSKEDEQRDAKGQKVPGAKPVKAAAAPGEDSQQIKRIKAKQKVVMVSTPAGKDEQSATSDAADYDVASQMVELTGNVHIKQGKNIITGSKVTMNLKTSEYTVDGAAPAIAGSPAPGTATPGRRVSTVLFPKAKDDGKTPAAAAATTPTKAAAEKPAPATGPAKQPTTSSWTTTSPQQ